jgi:type II secretory ATPase GspE/PulE/Tfp pilus assembly ATPase PilB-like protein
MSDSNVGTKTRDSTVALGFKQIIERAVRAGATDIHLEPMERVVIVRYRRGGVLYVANKLPKQVALPLARYLKELANLDTDQTSASQTGQTIIKIGRSNYHLTLSTLPLLDGEKITIHIQSETLNVPSLKQLGLWGNTLGRIEFALGLPKGLIVICGLQNLQTSRTLVSLLRVYSSRPIKTALIDENMPPLPPTISLFSPSPKSTFSPPHYLRLLQKRGVEVIGINPVMSKSTARETVSAAKKGCVIVAGVPSTNIAKGLVFLSQLSQEPIGIGFGGVAVGQVVVRGLCPHCRQPYRPTPAEAARLKKAYGLNSPGAMELINRLEAEAFRQGIGSEASLSSSKQGINRLWQAKPHGCKLCDHSGFSGSVGIFEACQLNDTIAGQLINSRSPEMIYQTALDGGMVSLAQDGLVKALRGMIDLPTVFSLEGL